jgi:hypothetical protein
MLTRAELAAADLVCRRLAAEGKTLSVAFAAIDLLVTIGYLQLALKHPTLSAVQQADLARLIHALAAPLRRESALLGAIVDEGHPVGSGDVVTVPAWFRPPSS